MINFKEIGEGAGAHVFFVNFQRIPINQITKEPSCMKTSIFRSTVIISLKKKVALVGIDEEH